MCLGVEHVPVGPLTREQTELARLAASTSSHGDTKPGESEKQGEFGLSIYFKRFKLFEYSILLCKNVS